MNRKRTIEVRVPQVSPFLESCAELDRHLAAASQLRAETTAAMFALSARAIRRGLRAAFAPVARWQRRRATAEALMACSDRILADIGIEREHIPLLARGLDPHALPPEPALLRRWQEMRRHLAAARDARRERLRIRRELAAYDDRELDEVGIRRVDIGAIAQGRNPAPMPG